MLYQVHVGFKLATLVEMGTDCIGSCKLVLISFSSDVFFFQCVAKTINPKPQSSEKLYKISLIK